jgi:hypothetical protein
MFDILLRNVLFCKRANTPRLQRDELCRDPDHIR